MKTLGIYYLATNEYCLGFSNFINSLKNFMPELEKTVLIISDKLEEYDGVEVSGIKCKLCRINHYPWPMIALFKMYNINRFRGNYDYVMYCDSSLIFYEQSTVDLNYWLESGKIILTRHAMSEPYNLNDGEKFNSYPVKGSISYIDPQVKFTYVQAGFFFGPAKNVYKMCYEISQMVERDLSRRLIPKWHDETYLNRWQIDNKDLVDNTKKVMSLRSQNDTVFLLKGTKITKEKSIKKIKTLNISMTNGRFGNLMYPLMVGITYARNHEIFDLNVFETNTSLFPDIFRKSLSNIFNFSCENRRRPRNDIFYTCSMNELIPRYDKEEVTIGGYLQNHKLIDEDLCREIFKCPEEVKNSIINTYGDLSDVVGLSVRRGNYVGHLIYQTLTVEFIERMINKYYSGRTIICCSDDIVWCKDNLSHIPNIIFQDLRENKMLIDWFVLTMTWSNILSCSSFSQSAGLLNPRKHCIVPTPYFKPDSEVDWNDLLVPEFAIREPLYL